MVFVKSFFCFPWFGAAGILLNPIGTGVPKNHEWNTIIGELSDDEKDAMVYSINAILGTE